MPCVDHQAQHKGLQGIKSRGQQRDRHILHTAAEGKGTDKAGPQEAVTLGGHQHAVGHAYGQIAGHNGDGMGKRRLHRRGKAPVLHGITSFEAWDNGAIIM